jgi:predicted extracellular nuclease
VRPAEVALRQRAQVVNDFADEILAADQANVIELGDINDFEFSQAVAILEGGVLTTLMETLPKAERSSYVVEGNAQVLDQILVSDNLLANSALTTSRCTSTPSSQTRRATTSRRSPGST